MLFVKKWKLIPAASAETHTCASVAEGNRKAFVFIGRIVQPKPLKTV